MRIEKKATLLQIFLGSSDTWQGQSLALALVERAHREGLAGATVLHGETGYGAHHQVHAASLVDLAHNLPLKIEIVDSRDRVERFVAGLGDMIAEGTVTFTDCTAIRYLRAPGD